MELNDNTDGRTRWEYHTLEPMMLNSSSLDGVLHEFGWLGWEIASTNIFFLPGDPHPYLHVILKKSFKIDVDTMRHVKSIFALTPKQDE